MAKNIYIARQNKVLELNITRAKLNKEGHDVKTTFMKKI